MLLLVVFAVELLHTQFAMAAPRMVNYGEPCNPSSNTTYMCQSPFQCDRHLRRCDCPLWQYADISLTCQDRIPPGNHCDSLTNDVVRQCVPNAFCNSRTHNCSCYPDYHYDSTTKACMTPLLKVGSNCSNNSDCESASCNGSSHICDCPVDHFEYQGKCSPRLSPHSSCNNRVPNTTKQCVDNASCGRFLTAYICLCNKDTFSNGSHCGTVVNANESCNYRITEPQQCTDHSHCDRRTNRCMCESGFFQNNTHCSPTVSAGQHCDAALRDPSGLQCTNYSSCTVVSSTNTAACRCKDDYYNKLGTCYRKLTPMQNCTSRDTCVDNAACHNSICTCNSDWFFDPFGGNCHTVLNVGDGCNPLVVDQHQCSNNSHCGVHPATCTCNVDYFRNGSRCEPVIKAGEACNSSLSNVCVPNADCKNDTTQNTNKCLCKDTHYNNNGVCANRILPMARCNTVIMDTRQCVENATCDANLHVCICTNGLVANLVSGICENMSQVQCNSQTGSTTLFDGCPAHAHCVNSKCECEDGYERTAQSQLCQSKIRPIKAGVDCIHPSDTCVSNATCTKVDSFAFCRCNNGSYNKFGECAARVRSYGVCYSSVLDPLQCVDGAQCTAGHCQCLTSYYVDHPSDLCYPRITAGTSCNASLQSDQCVGNASCTRDVCECNDGFFSDSGNCLKQFSLGTNCDPNIHGQCGGYSMAACDAIKHVCTCGAGFYVANGYCQKRGLLGDLCSPQIQDAEQCIRHAHCNSLGRCDCEDGFFNNAGFCSERVELGEPCNPAANSTMQCLDANAACNGTSPVCTCKTGFAQQANLAGCNAIVH